MSENSENAHHDVSKFNVMSSNWSILDSPKPHNFQFVME